MIKRLITSGLVAVLAMSSAAAQAPTVQAQVSPDSIGIGDRFTYSITVEKDLAQIVAFPEFESNPQSPIELISQSGVDTLERDGRRMKIRKSFNLTTFEAGRINLGRSSVLYVDKNITDTLYSADSLLLEVGTFKIDSTSHTIFDLKVQRNLPFKYAEISGYVKYSLIALAIILAIIFLLARYLKSRGKSFKTMFQPTPPPPPHIEAIAALESIQNQKLWQNDKHKLYYSSITDVLRRYISRRYDIAALEMTSEQILTALRDVDLPQKSSMDLVSLLQDADLVKFAKAIPESAENEASYYKAYYFVEETKQQDEQEDSNA